MPRLFPLAPSLLCGCTTTATFLTRDTGLREARIVGEDRTSLLVQTESGAERVLARADVVDIDHPGNVVALVGGIIAGSGALNLATVSLSCAPGLGSTGSQCGFISGAMGSMVATGAGMLTWGLWTWLTSRGLVTSTLENRPPPSEPSIGPPPASHLLPSTARAPGPFVLLR
jgi:hypothetical protein